MSEVVRCGSCGIRYDGRHAKCPRCRGRAPRRLERARAGGQRLEVPVRAIVGIVVGVIVATVALIWAMRPGDLVRVPMPSSEGPGPLAALVRTEPSRPIVSDRVPGELPFVDSAVEGRQAYQRGEYDAALERFRDQISRRPTDPASHSNAGQILVRLGRPTEALPYLEKAVALDPDRWAYRFNLARGRAAVGDWALAASDYQEAARLFPGDYATVFNLAQALHRAGQEEEAVARYREAIGLKPDDATFHLALGISEEKRGQLTEAVAAYRKFLEMTPKAKEAQGVRARIERLEKAAAVPAATPAAPPAAPPAEDRYQQGTGR